MQSLGEGGPPPFISTAIKLPFKHAQSTPQAAHTRTTSTAFSCVCHASTATRSASSSSTMRPPASLECACAAEVMAPFSAAIALASSRSENTVSTRDSMNAVDTCPDEARGSRKCLHAACIVTSSNTLRIGVATGVQYNITHLVRNTTENVRVVVTIRAHQGTPDTIHNHRNWAYLAIGG